MENIRITSNVIKIIFALYLDDLENYLSAYCLEINDNDLNVYLKLFVLLYADNTATSEDNH